MTQQISSCVSSFIISTLFFILNYNTTHFIELKLREKYNLVNYDDWPAIRIKHFKLMFRGNSEGVIFATTFVRQLINITIFIISIACSTIMLFINEKTCLILLVVIVILVLTNTIYLSNIYNRWKSGKSFR